jgi:hypothetical protein
LLGHRPASLADLEIAVRAELHPHLLIHAPRSSTEHRARTTSEPRLHLGRESEAGRPTRARDDEQNLRVAEQLKVFFGKAHFLALDGVDYLVTTTAEDIPDTVEEPANP